MANGTTLTISTRRDLNYKAAVTPTDAGDPGLATPTFIYDDDETQGDLLQALEQARLYVIENVAKR